MRVAESRPVERERSRRRVKRKTGERRLDATSNRRASWIITSEKRYHGVRTRGILSKERFERAANSWRDGRTLSVRLRSELRSERA